MKSGIENAIERNRARNLKTDAIRRTLSHLTRHYYDYLDAGKGEQCDRIRGRLKDRLKAIKGK